MSTIFAPRRVALASGLGLLLGLAACSSGGGDSSPAGGGGSRTSASLLVDSSSGSQVTLNGLIAVIAFERGDRSLTPNLLRNDASVCLARADGGASEVELTDAPVGEFVAVHLAFSDGGLTAVAVDGTPLRVQPTSATLRLPLAAPLQIASGAPVRLALRHSAPLALTATTPGNATWDPVFDIAPVDVVPIHFARIEVMSVDTTARRWTGAWLQANGRVVEVAFATDPLLVREPDTTALTVDAFLAGLAIGAQVLVDGLIDLDDEILATTAIDLGVSDPHGNGRSGAVEARIVALDPTAARCEIDVIEWTRGRGLLPAAPLGRLQVDVSGARIKWVPRRGRHPGHLAFGDLEVGMVVDISWHGVVSERLIPADKVDIRSSGTVFERAFEGVLTAISARPRRIGLHLAQPVVVDGRRLVDVELDFDDELLVARASDSAVRRIELSDVVVGEAARVLFDPRGRGGFHATMIILEWR